MIFMDTIGFKGVLELAAPNVLMTWAQRVGQATVYSSQQLTTAKLLKLAGLNSYKVST